MANKKTYGDVSDLEESVLKICVERDFTFLGFVGGKCVDKTTKLILRCNKCGYVWESTSIYNFLKQDRRSHTCGRKTPSSVIVNAYGDGAENKIITALNGTKYVFISFDENGYIGWQKTHVILKCTECGKVFKIKYSTVINGIKRCPCCGRIENEDSVVKKIKKVCEFVGVEFLGFNSYDGKYAGKRTKLILKCKKCGYIWKTTATDQFIHLQTRCRKCFSEWKSEYDIDRLLSNLDIPFEHDYRKFGWLKHKIRMSLDFYIPSIKLGIECQGIQHFKPNKRFGGEESFKETVVRDTLKKELCDKNGVELIYYSPSKKQNMFLGEQVFNDKEKLLNYIVSKVYGRKKEN